MPRHTCTPPWCLKRSTAAAMTLPVLFTAMLLLSHLGAALEYMVTNGFVQDGQVYSEPTLLNLQGLDKVREVTSVATVSNGQLDADLEIGILNGNTPDTLSTMLFMTVIQCNFGPSAMLQFSYLPRSAYMHVQQTRIHNRRQNNGIMAQGEGLYNCTILIEDTEFSTDGTPSTDLLSVFTMSNVIQRGFRFYSVVHIKKVKCTRGGVLVNTHALYVTHEVSYHSALIIEDVTCAPCTSRILTFMRLKIADYSVFIVRKVVHTNMIQNHPQFFFEARTITVDATSLLSFIDIDISNGFQGTNSAAFQLSSIDGTGTIVFSRLSMHQSGLTTLQPVNNAKFWVSARTSASTDLTPQQLRDQQKFNVNTDNTYKWDGTGDDAGVCVPVGGGIPDRATYQLVNGKCVATCKAGYLPPACTQPSPPLPCVVPNCDLCYRNTRTKCLVCAPHTTHEKDDTECRCPIVDCRTCPTATECTQCQDGYNVSTTGNSCIRCSIDVPKCFHCTTASKCDECEPYYNVSTDQKTCFDCRIDNCLSCSADKVCAQCQPQYNLTNPGKPNNRCMPCLLENCVLCGSDNNCQQCAEGYTKPAGGTGDCVPCNVQHCERCDAANECAQCTDKYTSDGTGHCLPCTMPGCLSCHVDKECEMCADNYTLYDKKCIECAVEHCTDCRENGVCSVCAGSLVPALSGSECISCNVTNCTICSSSDVCSMCQCGMVPTEDGDACVPCIASNCKHCSLTDNGKKCAVCDAGYEVRDEICVKVMMPPWAVFLIVVAGTLIISIIAALCVWYYLRYQAEMRQNAVDAEDRRRSRQSNHAAARNYDIIVLDLGDIEAAASGVADNQKTIAL